MRHPLWRFGAADAVFGLVLAMALVGGHTKFLNDPGTFWHVRLGRDVLKSGAVPRTDSLTFTRAGAPWVDQSWAFDAGLAWLVDHGGWSAAVAVSAFGFALVYRQLARGLIREGTTASVAVVVSVIAAGVGAIHFLVRPHLFTFAFVLWTLQACRSYHLRGAWRIATVPIVMIAWANLHGGFLAGPIIVATAGLGHAISGRWDRARGRRLGGFAVVFVLSLVAPLVNPYGFGLYGHVGDLLVSSGVTDLIHEYQPPPFGKGEARVLELVVLALIGLPVVSKARPSRYDLLHALVWLHFALTTIRHAPLFALAVAPMLADWIDGWASARAGRTVAPRFSPWPWLTGGVLAILVMSGVPVGRVDESHWPISALTTLDRQPAEARLFHEQDWGGLIVERSRSGRRSYIDDRFELFGRERVLEYVGALQGGPSWDALAGRERIGLVWVRPDRGLARRLAEARGWSVLHRDAVSVLYAKDEPGHPARRRGDLADYQRVKLPRIGHGPTASLSSRPRP